MNEDKFASIHDAYYDVHGVCPTLEMVIGIGIRIPNDILILGEQWGYNDTEFIDKLCNLIEKEGIL